MHRKVQSIDRETENRIFPSHKKNNEIPLFATTQTDTGSIMLGEVSHVYEISCFSHVRLCATPQTVAHQAPLSMGLSRQEYWSGLPHPSPGDLPDPGIEPTSLKFPALAGGFFYPLKVMVGSTDRLCIGSLKAFKVDPDRT